MWDTEEVSTAELGGAHTFCHSHPAGSRRASPASPLWTHPVSPPTMAFLMTPTSPADNRNQFNVLFGLLSPLWVPLTAHPLPLLRPPFVTCQNGPISAQFARFLASSTNSPCPFDTHDHRTFLLLFFFPSLTLSLSLFHPFLFFFFLLPFSFFLFFFFFSFSLSSLLSPFLDPCLQVPDTTDQEVGQGTVETPSAGR